MTYSDVVLIADLIKVQLKHATEQTNLNMGHPIMFWEKCVGIERQSNRITHKKKSLISMYTATGFGLIILILLHTAETSLYRCIHPHFNDVMTVARFSSLDICHYSLKI